MAEQIPDQQGRIVVVSIPLFTAGLDAVYAMEARVRWWLKAVKGTLTCSADVADRLPELVITQSGHQILRLNAANTLSANEALIFNWAECGASTLETLITSRADNLPANLHLNDQAVISIEAVGMQVGDQWSDFTVYAEEWIEPLA